MFVLLDSIWDGLDEGREAGYRWLLEDLDNDVVVEAVRELAEGIDREPRELKWLPKAPEVHARCQRIIHRRDTREWVDSRMAQLEARERQLLTNPQEEPDGNHQPV